MMLFFLFILNLVNRLCMEIKSNNSNYRQISTKLRVILWYPPKKGVGGGGLRYPLVGNLLIQVTFFSHLTVPSSHCAVPISHVTVLFSHLVVLLPFSHIWQFHPHIVQWQKNCHTWCSNITCDNSFVTLDGSLTFFSHLTV